MSRWGVDDLTAALAEMRPAPAAPPAPARAAQQVRRSYESGNYLSVVPDFTGEVRGQWDRITGENLELLVRRSRWAFKNVPELRRFGKLYQRHVIGPAGIVLQNQSRDVRVKSGQVLTPLDRAANKAIEDGFRRWGAHGIPTLCRRHSWRSLQHLAGLHVARDGEFLAIEHLGVKNGWGYALQVIDPLQLNHHLNVEDYTKTTRIVQGVEVDAWGGAINYFFIKPEHFRRGVMHAGPREHVQVSAERVIHVYHPEFAFQTRGVPIAHAVMFNAYAAGEYDKAHLIASVLGAQQTQFIETTEGAEVDAGLLDPDLELDDGPEQGQTAATADADGARREVVQAGSRVYLGPGERVSQYKPNAPNNTAESLMRGQQQRIAAGLDVVEWMLSGVLKDVNLSTARIARQDFVDGVRPLQCDISEPMHGRVFPRVLFEGLIRGRFTWPDGRPMGYSEEKFAKWNAPSWQPRGYAYMDPKAEAAANEQNMRNGLETPQALAAGLGRDFDTILEEQAEALAAYEELGLPLPSWAQAAKPAAPPPGAPAKESAPTSDPDPDEDKDGPAA